MDCDDCERRIFELIEREPLDPEGVRAILEKCPKCRQLFDEMKAASMIAARLPLEEPPAAVDASILDAARARVESRPVPRRRWLEAPPWALAAVVLLAVGVGLWVSPAEDRKTEDVAPPAPVEPELRAAADRGDAAAREMRAREWARLEASASREGPITVVRAPELVPFDAPRAEARRASPRAEKAQIADRDAAQEMALAEEAAAGDAVASQPAEIREVSTECAKRMHRAEQARRDARPDRLSSDEALAVGRCYHAADDADPARFWLERAAKDPETRARASRLLRTLAPE